MSTWVNTLNVGDLVRSPQQDGWAGFTIPVEIEVASSVRVFVDSTDLDNKDIAAVVNTTGTTVTIGKGSDGDPVFGFITDISKDGAVAQVLLLGDTPWVAYAAATEDPDVNNSVQSKGSGKVKQSVANPTESAGQAEIGRGRVYKKDTTNSYVKLVFP